MDTLFFAVVNRDKANMVWHKAQEFGATEGTIFLAEGTKRSRVLEMLGLAEMHKAILMISASYELCDKLHDSLSEALELSKRNSGIAFSIPFKHWQPKSAEKDLEGAPEGNGYSHVCIMTIVDKGSSHDCLKAARAAGARGATLIHARGAGVPTEYYFPLVIEPQKDIIMIIAAIDKAASIRDRITCEMELDKTGNGMIFTLPVLKTSGLIENKSEESRGLSA